MLLSSCTYIDTLNPSGNQRLFQLKQESLARAEKTVHPLSLNELQKKIEALKSPSILFRTHLKDRQVIVEAFTGMAQLKDLLSTVFHDQPMFWDTVTLINGERTDKDRLPKDLLLAEGLRWGLVLEKDTEHGTALSHTLSGEGKDLANAQAIAGQIRQLLLVNDGAKEPQGGQYRIRWKGEGGSGDETLIFDAAQRLHIQRPDGSSLSFVLLNPSQWTLLKTGLDVLLVSGNGNGAPFPGIQVPESASGLDLPLGDPEAVIGRAEDILSESGGHEQILIESALVGRLDLTQGNYVGDPQAIAGFWHQSLGAATRKNLVETSRPINLDSARSLAKSWDISGEEFDALTKRLEAEALFQFLQLVIGRNAALDPAINWR